MRNLSKEGYEGYVSSESTSKGGSIRYPNIYAKVASLGNNLRHCVVGFPVLLHSNVPVK